MHPERTPAGVYVVFDSGDHEQYQLPHSLTEVPVASVEFNAVADMVKARLEETRTQMSMFRRAGDSSAFESNGRAIDLQNFLQNFERYRAMARHPNNMPREQANTWYEMAEEPPVVYPDEPASALFHSNDTDFDPLPPTIA